jgi:hypothetical protein
MAITFRANKGQALTYAEMDTNLGSYYFSSSLDGNNLYLHYTGSAEVPINQSSHRIPLTAGQVAGTNFNVQYNNAGNLDGAPDFIYSGSKVGVNNSVSDLTYNLEVSGSIRASDALLSNSDERLKENIYPIDNALSRVSQIEGVYFNWNNKTERQVGVIAQQVEKVLPEVVSEDKDSYLSVDYSKLVPLLFEAINEQSSIIMDLEERISKLEK